MGVDKRAHLLNPCWHFWDLLIQHVLTCPLSANRTLTLSTCTPRHGHVLEVVRTASATGAFSIDVGRMKVLATAGSSARLVYRSGFWVLLG
jgi:hypothetical protein